MSFGEREKLIESLKEDPSSLKYASDELKNDREIARWHQIDRLIKKFLNHNYLYGVCNPISQTLEICIQPQIFFYFNKTIFFNIS